MKKWAWPWAKGAPKEIWGSPLIFLQRLKVATSRLAGWWTLPKPITNPTQKKSWLGHGLLELPKILEFPFNISPTAEAGDLKFSMPLVFAKARHKITPRGKLSMALG